VNVQDINSPKEFGTRLKQLRQQHSITQGELADRAGVTQQTISAIENGRLDPSLKLLLEILGILGATLLLSTLTKGAK